MLQYKTFYSYDDEDELDKSINEWFKTIGLEDHHIVRFTTAFHDERYVTTFIYDMSKTDYKPKEH